MARNIFEEKIRLGIEATGDAELKKVVDSFGDLGDVAEDEAGKARAAMEAFAKAVDDAANVKSFAALRGELVKTEASLEAARLKAAGLFQTVSDGGAPSAALKKQQEAAAKAVNTVAEAVQAQKLQLQGLRGTLSASGIDTRKLGTAQGELKARLAEARSELSSAGKAVAAYRTNAVKAAADVPAANARIADSYTGIGSALVRLRSIAAPVLAFLTFRTAAQGVTALADVAAQAENARRSFQNLYGGVDAGNRAFESLRAIAKENGLAFADVTDDAKKLKAFGLDPLNGSYQALVDQNAAVGGSQQDLSGKVLALGQAWAKQKLQGEEILQLVERGVPVWSLLEKATGKNVTQLQKLSEQGKLGRDVIQQLYEEIGKANSGAAERGLSGLSGLLAQASARWRDFMSQVADSGVTEYFKLQIDALLGSTGNLDQVAKRVAAGVISSLEAVKQFGQQLALIAKPVADVASALARHAGIVATLAKVYVGLKLVRFAGEFLALSRAQIAAAASADALTVATGRGAGALGGLGAAMGKIPRTLQIGIALAGVDYALSSVVKLQEAIAVYQETQGQIRAFEQAQTDLSVERLALGKQLQAVYAESASVAVASTATLTAMTTEQAVAYKATLEGARQYFRGVITEARETGNALAEATATTRFKELGVAIVAVGTQITELNAKVAGQTALDAFANGAVEKFDALIGKSKSAKEAMTTIFDGVDLTRAEGLTDAVKILEQINARGTAAAAAVKLELAEAISKVSDADLPKLKASAEAAFAAGTVGAQQLTDAIGRIGLTRLGVDIEAIKSGFTSVGRVAVDNFKLAISEVDRLGLTVEQRSAAVAAAFDKAFASASTKTELANLKVAINDAMSGGDLAFAAFQERVVQVDGRLAALGNTGKDVGTKVSEGAAQAGEALGNIETATDSAQKGTEKLAEGIDDASKFMGDASKEGQLFALANYAVSESAAAAYVSLNKFAGSGALWRSQINGLTKAINDQGKALNEQIQRLQEANGAFDEFAGLRKQLAAQYDKLGSADIDRLLQAEQQLEQNRTAAAAKRAQQQEEELRRAEAISAAASAGAGASGSTATGNRAVAGARRVVIRIETAAGDVELEGNEGDDVTTERLLRTLGQARSVSTRRRR